MHDKLGSSISSRCSQELQDVDEDHDDVDVEHECAHDVLVHVEFVAAGRLAAHYLHCVYDEVHAVEHEAEGAVDDVKDR